MVSKRTSPGSATASALSTTPDSATRARGQRWRIRLRGGMAPARRPVEVGCQPARLTMIDADQQVAVCLRSCREIQGWLVGDANRDFQEDAPGLGQRRSKTEFWNVVQHFDAVRGIPTTPLPRIRPNMPAEMALPTQRIATVLLVPWSCPQTAAI